MTAPQNREPSSATQTQAQTDDSREIDPGTVGYDETSPIPQPLGVHATRGGPNPLEHFVVRNDSNGNPVAPWILLHNGSGKRSVSANRSGQIQQDQRLQALVNDAAAFTGTQNLSYFQYIPLAGLASIQPTSVRGWQWKKGNTVVARFEVAEQTVNGVTTISEKVSYIKAAFPPQAPASQTTVIHFPNAANLPALTGTGVVHEEYHGTLKKL